MSLERPDRNDAAGTRSRRPYTSPRLIEDGSVARLTQGTMTKQQDGPADTSWKRAGCL